MQFVAADGRIRSGMRGDRNAANSQPPVAVDRRTRGRPAIAPSPRPRTASSPETATDSRIHTRLRRVTRVPPPTTRVVSVACHPWRPGPGPVMFDQRWEWFFLHWPVDPSDVAPFMPPGSDRDEFDGATYVALVPFRMSGAGLGRGHPMPWWGTFVECNVRSVLGR